MPVLINPRLPLNEALEIKTQLAKFSHLKSHYWVATSGSSSLKWAALSDEALSASAAAVNSFLSSDGRDIWFNALPFFHVGGLGIERRAQLSGATLIFYSQKKWEVHHFFRELSASKATLTALVPTQLYDLVKANFRAPSTLRAVIIGGSALSELLYSQGVALGWPLRPSYGFTECCSQVATAELVKTSSPPLKLLPHIEAKLTASGHLQIRSPALLTYYAIKKGESYELSDPKLDGWFITEDYATLGTDSVQILGRNSAFIKIGGESSDLTRLENILTKIRLENFSAVDIALFAAEDERLGHVIHLAVAGKPFSIEDLVAKYQKLVLPFERIRKIHYLPYIPRTALFKLAFSELKVLIEKK